MVSKEQLNLNGYRLRFISKNFNILKNLAQYVPSMTLIYHFSLWLCCGTRLFYFIFDRVL